jgi:hypothetical protein
MNSQSRCSYPPGGHAAELGLEVGGPSRERR